MPHLPATPSSPPSPSNPSARRDEPSAAPDAAHPMGDAGDAPAATASETPTAFPPERFAFRLLGAFELLRDGVVVDGFGQRRDEELLAYLVYSGHTLVSRDVLAATLWPDLSLDTGRKNVSLNLFMLRRRLLEHGLADGIQAVRKLLRIDPAIDIDAHRFTRALAAAATTSSPTERVASLDRAVRLYGAGLLPDFRFPWLAPEQERFRALFQDATRQLALLTQPDDAMQSVIRNLPPTAWQAPPAALPEPAPPPVGRQEPRSLSPADVQEIRAFAAEAAAGLQSPDSAAWVRRVAARERDILRAADLVAMGGDAQGAVRLVVDLWRFWHRVNRQADGAQAILQVLANAPSIPEDLRAEAYGAAGNLSVDAGRPEDAIRYLTRALDHWQRAGDADALMRVNANLARAAMRLGRHEDAERHFQHALVLARSLDLPAAYARVLLNAAMNDVRRGDADSAIARLDERRAVLGASGAPSPLDAADTDAELAAAHVLRGAMDAAAEHALAALSGYQAAESPAGMARSAALLGWICYQRGNLVDARMHMEQAVASARGSGRAWTLGMALGYLSVVLEAQDDPKAGATLWDAIAILRTTGEEELIERLTGELADMRAGRGGTLAPSGGM